MGIIDFVFPKRCLNCGVSGFYICNSCLGLVDRAFCKCIYCGNYSYWGRTHKSCNRRGRIDGAFAIWRYEGVVRKALLKFKYSFSYDIVDELVKRSINDIKNYPFNLGSVLSTSVPMKSGKERWRGFNQASLIGVKVAYEMGWKFDDDILIKTKNTRSQAGLVRRERIKNLRGAFEINNKYKKNFKEYDSLVVFDDVLTTGSTIRECGEVLKKAGAKVVWGITIAS